MERSPEMPSFPVSPTYNIIQLFFPPRPSIHPPAPSHGFINLLVSGTPNAVGPICKRPAFILLALASDYWSTDKMVICPDLLNLAYRNNEYR